jgi:signal recognition particle receptor subunit beta
MPIYDPLTRRLVVRVVYDGPGTAGKTTNVQQLCRLFPVSKRTELYTPGALKGRTMFFDWLEVDVATKGKLPLRVQILSVTGQETRSYRRRPLLKSADAVVFVCDSRPHHLDNNRQRLLLLQRYLRERHRPAPYLIQANKQDLPGALPPEQLLSHLRWKAEVPVLPAVASESRGVTETFQQAARAAAKYAQSIITERGISEVVGTPETPDGLLDQLLTLEERVETAEGEAFDPEPTAGEEAQHLHVSSGG